jgi:hypothetical protein
VYKLDVSGDVPVDAFWSVIVYDATGHIQKNTLNAYSLNSITAKKAADGSFAVQFGGCDGKIPNRLPVNAGLENRAETEGKNDARQSESDDQEAEHPRYLGG